MKIGIDLGTCNSIVFVKGKGIVLSEPTVVAVSQEENRVLAIGKEAKEMLGRTPDTIVAYRPLRDGVIADFRVTEAMLRYFIRKVQGHFSFTKPEVLIGIPAGATSTERRAVIEAALKAGAKEAFVAKEPILSAIGAGIPINSSSGNMIVDIGGGTTEVAVISLGGIVSASSVRVGGDKFDSAIENYIKEKYDLAIGEQTAERIKIQIGSAMPPKEEKKMRIKGRDLVLGLPKTIEISSTEICQSLQDQLGEILQCVKSVLKETPPEISADIMDKGMVLAGGGSLLRRIDEYLAKNTGVPSQIAEEPFFCVAKGTGIVLEHLDTYKKSIMAKKA
ncbi:MAG TPA: rod shape-determining protein [Candidatus Pacearchaeota archaeon]|nr:rod shape-determining protein [Candidatus Pacearchaeota archaeon]HOK94105.1 rod shape-determining protein [Candidatus Pacearchaeota archaeon]HPO75233.1 rod shape-determining protein [Candidatus Pacearchaeota archaeon]